MTQAGSLEWGVGLQHEPERFQSAVLEKLLQEIQAQIPLNQNFQKAL